MAAFYLGPVMALSACVFSPLGPKEETHAAHTLTNFVLLLRMEQHICHKVQLPLLIPKLGTGPTPVVI